MLTLGIDIGSTTSKAVILEEGKHILSASLAVAGIGTNGPEIVLREAMEKAKVQEKDISHTVVTGYGRNTYKAADARISELTCHAIGGSFVFPEMRTLIDIGGQDAKVLSVDENGMMQNFVMNDKCAAGTGRFLDVMAGILHLDINDLSKIAAQSRKPVSISSTCTVFAESEVISQLATGADLPDLVAGICASVAGKVAVLAKRLGVKEKVFMSGGVAQNTYVRETMGKILGVQVYYSPQSQTLGALGAALYAYSKSNHIKQGVN